MGTRTVIKPVAYVKDVKAFIEMVRKERRIPEERMMARIAMDYGRGSFKVVISIFDRDAMSDKLAPGECKGRLYTGLYSTIFSSTKLQVRRFVQYTFVKHCYLVTQVCTVHF